MKLTQHFFEALRTRMENILRSLSGNRKAYIIYGNTIATDVKNQVVLEPRDCIIPGINCSLVELYLFYKACTAHEGGHIRFTSKKAWDEAALAPLGLALYRHLRAGAVHAHLLRRA